VKPSTSSTGSRDAGELTRILSQVSAGVPAADKRLLEVVYAELKRIAAAKMAVQDPGHTLQPTALVHEAYLRLLGKEGEAPSFRGSAHFFTAAAASMRSILVDHARRKQAVKRSAGAARVTLDNDLIGDGEPLENILQVHEALESLAVEHPRTAEIVELLFFAGLTAGEAGSVLDLSERTVEREWRFARAWLMRMMEDE
jgi:RNA polymerase sigma factor (TIGR02999 family)